MSNQTKLLVFGALLASCGAVFAQWKPEGWPLGVRIPAINGQVVDAITGKPVADLDVTLRATAAREITARYENYRTSKKGRFAFRWSRAPSGGSLFGSMEGYWLTVNETFWSLAWMKAQNPDREPTIDTTSDETAWDFAYDPLFNHKETVFFEYRMPGSRVNNEAYFPMAVQFGRPCHQFWNANCVSFPDTKNVRVPLIPVLNNSEQCKEIKDPAVAEQCRQLNTYRAAFLHVETADQVSRDEEICRKVDNGGPGTSACLQFLPIYVGNPNLFKNR